MMASKALPQFLLRRSRCFNLNSTYNNIIGNSATRHLSSSASNLATQDTSNIVACPPNLKFGPRTVSSPFFGLDRIEQQEQEQANDDGIEEEVEVEDEDDDDITQKLQQLDLYDLSTKPDTTYRAIPLPERLTVPIWDIKDAATGENSLGELKLNADVFGLTPIRTDLIHRVVIYQRNKKRGVRYCAVTKTISQVSGSGRKMRPQKGSGRARAGHSRPPHWRGGAKAHGPKGAAQDYTTKLNKKVRRLGLKHMLSQKLLEGNLIVVDKLAVDSFKTKDLAKTLSEFGIGKHASNAFLVDGDGELDANFRVAQRNLQEVKIVSQLGCNVYDILKKEKLVLSVDAVQALEERLTK